MLEFQAFSDVLLGPAPPRESTFVSAHDGCLTHAAFVEAVSRAACLLGDILNKKQSIVFVISENTVTFAVALVALNHLAQVVVPVFAGCSPREMQELNHIYRPSLVIADARFHALFTFGEAKLLSFEGLVARPARSLSRIDHSREDVALVLLTSGMRGASKGVVITNGNVLSDIAGIQAYMQVSQHARCLITRSLTHASALVGELLLTLLTGGSCVLRRTPNSMRALFDWCESEATTWMGVAPAVLNAIVEYGRRQHREIYPGRIVVSGALLSKELCLSFLATFPHTELINAYGLTEASPRVAYLPAVLAASKPGAVGYPIIGCRVRVVTEDGEECESDKAGEIEVSGLNVMRGYFPEGLRRSGVGTSAALRTGDVGYRDSDGVLYVVGRIDTMLVHNGLNIYPEYLNEVFEKCPAVRKAEIAHLKRGRIAEKLIAFVEIEGGASKEGALAAIRKHLADHLDIRKHPDEIVIVSNFPLTPSGKTDIKKLLEMYCECN